MSKGKKKVGFRWWSDWTILWIIGGFVLAYFVYIPITGDKVHPLHWLFGVLGGVAGYGRELFLNIGLPPVMRFVRHSSGQMTLKPNSKKQAKRRK